MNKEERFYIVDLIITGKRTFRYLLSKWYIILIFCFLGGLAGITYAWLKPPVYTAELIFSSETSADAALGGYAGLAAQFGFDLGGGAGGAFEGDNLMQLLRSNAIVQKTLLSDATAEAGGGLMIDTYVRNHELNKGWQKNEKLRNVRFIKQPSTPERNRDSILKAVTKAIIDKQLDIYKLDKKLNYVVVKMKDVDELFSKDFVEKLMANATDFYISYKSQKAKKNFNLISHMTDSIKGLLYGNIESYAISNDLNINPMRQQMRASGQKIQVNAQANSGLYTELLQQLGLAKITLQKETPLIQVIDQPMLPLKKEKPGRLKMGIIFSFVTLFIVVIVLMVLRWFRNAETSFKKPEYVNTTA